MKKQFKLLMYTGIMAGALMTSCKSSDSVVVYDDQARPANKVYRTSRGDAADSGTVKPSYTRPEQNGKIVYSASAAPKPNKPAIPDNQPVYQVEVVEVQSVPNDEINTPNGQYMPQVVDMSQQNRPRASHNHPAPPAFHSYGAASCGQVQTCSARKPNKSYQQTTGRNKSLDNNLYNRPNAYTLTEDMYTPEYRAMVNNRQESNYNRPAAPNELNSEPRVVKQHPHPQPHLHPHPQNEQGKPQQYVVPVEPQQQYNVQVIESQGPNTTAYVYSYSQNEVGQADANYPATLYFKNGAKLTGTLIAIDNSVCQFRMSEGRVANFATKDILRIEKR